MAENKVQMESWESFAEGKNYLFHNELLQGAASNYRKWVAQVVLRWLTQRGVVAIPKSGRPERITANFKSLTFELRAKAMQAIATLDTKASLFFDHRDPNMVKWISERKIHDQPFELPLRALQRPLTTPAATFSPLVFFL